MPKAMVAGAGGITLLAAAQRTTAVANSAGATVAGVDKYRRIVVLCNITASDGAVGDTLDVYVDVSLDGTKWLNAVHFTQQAGNGAARAEYAVLDPANPGTSVVNVTSDAAAGAVRPAAWGPYIRGRYTLVDAGAHGQNHTFSLTAWGQA